MTPLLQARNVWPRPTYARPWNFHLHSEESKGPPSTAGVTAATPEGFYPTNEPTDAHKYLQF